MIEKITTIKAHTTSNTTSKEKIQIPSWCREIEIYQLYGKTRIYAYRNTKQERRNLIFRNPAAWINRTEICEIYYGKAKKSLNYLIGTSKKCYALENKNSHNVRIVTNYEPNMFRCLGSFCYGCCLQSAGGDGAGQLALTAIMVGS